MSSIHSFTSIKTRFETLYRMFLWFVIFCFLSSNAFTQSASDTVLKRFEGRHDTAKVNALLKLTDHYKSSNPQLAEVYGHVLYKLANSMGDMEGLIDALNLMCRIHLSLGKMDTAMILVQQAIHLSDSIRDNKRKADALYLEAALNSLTKGPNYAIDKFFACYETYLGIPDSAGLANALNGIGVAYYEMAKYDSATIYYLKALQIAEKLNLTNVLGKLYLNMGTLYDVSDKPKEAKRSFFRSIPYNEQMNSMINVAKAYHNIGNIYVQEKNYDSAWYIYNKALELNLTLNYPHGIANAYIGLGDVADDLGEIKKSNEYFKKAKHYYLSISDMQGVVISCINLGRNQQQWGNYDAALQMFDTALLVSREFGFLRREAEVYRNYCFLYAEKGDYRQAYDKLWILLALRDSILDIEKQNNMAELEALYENEKYKAQLLGLTNENLEKNLALEQKTRQWNTLIFSGFALILILAFSFAYYSQRTRKNRIIAEQRIRQLEEEKKLLAASSIVEGQEEERRRIAKELHDGLGVLLSSAKMHFTNIREKSPEAQPMIDKATKLLEQATGDVRRISHNMMPGLLTRFGFYEAIEDLVEQVNDMEGIQAEVNIAGEQERLKENTEIMLYRIIQEMVNNTLKHANAKRMVLNISITPGNLEVEFADDGKGFELEEKRKLKSLGLTSIESRIRFLNGTLDVNTSPGKGTSYSFSVPV